MGLHLKVVFLVLLVDLADTMVEMIQIVEPQLGVSLHFNQLASRKGFSQVRVVFFRIGSAILLLKDGPSCERISGTTFNQSVGFSGATCNQISPSRRASSVAPVLELGGVTGGRSCNNHCAFISRFRSLHSRLDNLAILVLLSRQTLDRLLLGKSQEKGLRARDGKRLPFPSSELGLFAVESEGTNRSSERR